MHPSEVELIGYANAASREREGMAALAIHITACRSCQERIARIEGWNRNAVDSNACGLPAPAIALADRVLREAQIAARTIPLAFMAFDPDEEPARLAADGGVGPVPQVGMRHLATLYSEKPEIVLRVMRDLQTQEDTLHLLGRDPAQVRNVLVHIVEPPMDFVTDHQGVANLGRGRLGDPTSLRWEIHLPDATFQLLPLEHQPAAVAEELELSAEGGNRVGVAIERAAEGMVLRLRPIVIGGREDFDRIRLVVSQGRSEQRIVETRAGEPCIVSRLSASAPIDIRIFVM